MPNLMPILFFVLIALAFWLLIIRPQTKRQKEQQKLQSSAGPGERVMLISGIYATVVDRIGDDVLLEVAPGVEVRAAQLAIARVLPAEDAAAEDRDESEDVDDRELEDEDVSEPTNEELAAESDASEPDAAELSDDGNATTADRDPEPDSKA